MELFRRIRLSVCTGEHAALLDPDAVLVAARLLRSAVPLVPWGNGNPEVDVEAANVLADFHGARDCVAPAENDEGLSNLLYLVIDSLLPDGIPEPMHSMVAKIRADGAPAPTAAEVWNGEVAVLYGSFHATGRLDLLEEMILMARPIVDVTPIGLPRMAAYRTNLSVALLERFYYTQTPADAAQAIRLAQAAVNATSVNDPDRAGRLMILGNALQNRFTQSSLLADSDAAIEILGAAVDAAPEDARTRGLGLSGLCMCWDARFERTGAVHDLDTAIAIGRDAVAAMPAGDHSVAECLGNLAGALVSRFEVCGRAADLNEAIDLERTAMNAAADDPWSSRSIKSNLCGALLRRFEHAGVPGDLDEAIAIGRAGAAYAPAGCDPSGAILLTNLASALRVRYGHTEIRSDIDEAVLAARAAVASVPKNHPNRTTFLSGLGLALQDLFERTAALSDIDEAIEIGRALVAGTPNHHPTYIAYLSNLGLALRHRFAQTAVPADLDDAIAAARAVVAATPAGHPLRGEYLSNLGLALRTRFHHSSDSTDLEEAIETAREALALIPVDRPFYAVASLNLGLVLLLAMRQSGSRVTAWEAVQAFRTAAQSEVVPPLKRVQAAQGWGEVAAEVADLPEAALGYETAVELLAAATWHGIHRGDRVHTLSQVAHLASEAATAQLRIGQPRRAVELLEQARGVLIAHAVDARTDRALLSKHAPALADRMDAIMAELDHLDGAATVPAPLRAGDGHRTRPGTAQHFVLAASAHADRRARLAREWDELLTRVRQLPGLRNFMQIKSFAELQQCAAHGPVVIINIGRRESHALIVTPEDLMVCPLDQVTGIDAARRIDALSEALAHNDGHDAEGQQNAECLLDDTQGWIWDTIAEPVLNALGLTSTDRASVLPRLWWCPVGLAAFLPLHAAGRDGRPGPSASVMDCVVSSYTPTLRALIDARDRAAKPPQRPGKMLAFALPTTPDLLDLPATEHEVRAVKDLFPGETTILPSYDRNTHKRGTRAALLTYLPQHAFLHFAGHGMQDTADTHSGALYTYDHLDVGPTTVSDLAGLRLNDARLAFLSACQTAVGATNVPDEAIHIAGALQIAGFTHVVATSWVIYSSLAVPVATEFYHRIRQSDNHGQIRLDPADAARALHETTRQVRTHRSALYWAPYVHIGP
ncbi:CHAT domain-containing protein [Nocardia vinacea]|uniref:CHAT domain-containing protein n=1 Tax=Nocardia vinacea TaxID=96468 RepID=UPI002E0F25D5|nr:CHAT domain-containing protein [Nocardia vinacea]